MIDLTSSGEQPDQPDHEPSTGSTPIEPGTPQLIPNPEGVDAASVPIPPSDDDESLVCESIFVTEESCFHLNHDQVWEYEIEIGQKEIDQWKQEQVPADLCLTS